ncbi:hypothetical protein EZV62_024384 [Acer yangbiense]|uniref:CCT domain-containing protein n=1 Tax=Acer yangbiense TaxID=1000413 RepID=A0A5C7GVG4_9ROSI|nr:hypothetical protein EZV62_024384 [Acer yangbiense]
MGEVVLISEEMEVVQKTTPTTTTTDEKKDGLVKWERFLPKMVLRVLLVEADDSTRQIISALLRKSSYIGDVTCAVCPQYMNMKLGSYDCANPDPVKFKMLNLFNAVPDGLKAWEILKGRPDNIDIILTEVDLPSISGFALLTLIMEHQICKNIPVIMMSSQDSVSTVYKCMLRGAADYLVKPVRRNELRNLWQHVWRRQSTNTSGNSAQDESVGQKKIDISSENDAASNHSSGYMACVQRDEECNDKGSDAQSSCTKPDFEADGAHMEETQDLSMQLEGKCLPDDVEMQKHKSYHQKSLVHESEVGVGSVVAIGEDANREKAYLGMEVEPESQRKDLILTNEASDVHVNSSREVIDFMGAFNNLKSSSNNCTSLFDSSSQLDLSLRRSHPGGFENQVTEQKFTLNHSNASAFTRYTNKSLQPLHSALTSACNQQKEFDSEKILSNIVTSCNSDTPVAMPSTQRSISSLATSHSKQSELETSFPGRRVCPVQVPVEGMRLNNVYTGYGSVPPHMFCAQSALSPIPSSSSANEQEPTFRVNQMYCSNVENGNCTQSYDHRLGENAINSTNQTMHRLDSPEDRGHISPATDQSASSSFCNGAISRLNSMGYGSTCGSNSNVDQGAVVRVAAESKNEEGLLPSSGNSHRSIQREAALNKFRLKRKDRCYEKKVRYQSRKKLAEQRPRVKGQFVRQVQTDDAAAES